MTTSHFDLLDSWTRLWNGHLEVAHQICSPTFTIFFGRAEANGGNPADALVGPQALADFIRDFRAARPGITYSTVRPFYRGDLAVSLWNCDWADLHIGGIDVFDRSDDGLVRRVWSVTGQRPVLA